MFTKEGRFSLTKVLELVSIIAVYSGLLVYILGLNLKPIERSIANIESSVATIVVKQIDVEKELISNKKEHEIIMLKLSRWEDYKHEKRTDARRTSADSAMQSLYIEDQHVSLGRWRDPMRLF